MFFSERTSCIPVLELCGLYKEWRESGLVNYAALMNVVWKRFPTYAAIVNGREQVGANDLVGLLLRKMGIEAELNVCRDRLIAINPEAGTRFLTFQRGAEE